MERYKPKFKERYRDGTSIDIQIENAKKEAIKKIMRGNAADKIYLALGKAINDETTLMPEETNVVLNVVGKGLRAIIDNTMEELKAYLYNKDSGRAFRRG